MTMIAVVEDEPSISEVISLYLKRAGYQIQLYADGLAARQSLFAPGTRPCHTGCHVTRHGWVCADPQLA